MRLIDADKLPEVNTIERIEGEREVFVNSWIPAAAIWKAPTVEAIPTEWIKKKINAEPPFSEEGMYWCELLDDWRKENATD